MNITIKDGTCNRVKVHNYPDGQRNITLDMEYFDNVKVPIEITASIRNFQDLELLLCIVSALKKHDFFISKIYFVYLFGMRADRSFEIGMPNYFRDVLAPIINSLNIPKIAFLHPHSYLSMSCINNSYIDNLRIHDIVSSSIFWHSINLGADESVSIFGWERLNATLIKKRLENTINVSIDKVTRKLLNDSADAPIMLIDDLCDGGGTFIEAAKFLEKEFPNKKRTLYITHALFTKGIDIVADHFESIICTNSYQEIDHPKVKQHKVI